MRFILRAAIAAALCLAAPAFAQQQTTQYSGRGPNTLTFSVVAQNDTATIYLTGSSWASVYWTIATAGSGAITTEISPDGGTNWIASAYSKRIDAVSANPSVAPWANNGPVAGTYETPLPANCTAFRLRYQTAGTATSGTLTPGAAYAPGVPVVATLADVVEGGTGVGVATTIFDWSGWNVAEVNLRTPTTQVWTLTQVDDAGTAIAPGFVSTAAGSAVAILTPGASVAGPATLGASAHQPYAMGDKRFSLTLPAGGTVTTGRYRIVVRR